jgi:hypothetical protein
MTIEMMTSLHSVEYVYESDGILAKSIINEVVTYAQGAAVAVARCTVLSWRSHDPFWRCPN